MLYIVRGSVSLSEDRQILRPVTRRCREGGRKLQIDPESDLEMIGSMEGSSIL